MNSVNTLTQLILSMRDGYHLMTNHTKQAYLFHPETRRVIEIDNALIKRGHIIPAIVGMRLTPTVRGVGLKAGRVSLVNRYPDYMYEYRFEVGL